MAEPRSAASGKASAEAAADAPRPGVSIGSWLPGIVFVLILGIAGAVYAGQLSKQRAEDRAVAEQASALGLPAQYPLRDFPPYEGLKVTKAEREVVENTEGLPMDKWVVHGEVDADKTVVLEYYKAQFMDHNMVMQMNISMPTGAALHYADETRLVELEVEKLPSDALTQVRMNVYRVR